MSEKKEFVYKLNPSRPTFIQDMTAEEEAVMGRHFHYLQGLLKEQRLIMAGPCLDAEFGLVVFVAESEEEAREVMNNDPAIKEGVMIADLHPFRVSLLQGR
ncbi:MAG TPA: YciI family protein [Bacilli bacterium]|nr:YciI family protein [Bacilli bacterium]